MVSDPSKSNIECNGDNNPSESESSCTAVSTMGARERGEKGEGEVTSSATAIIERQESVRRRGRRRGEECECRDRRGSIERVVLRMSQKGGGELVVVVVMFLGFLGGKISETERHLIPEFHRHTQKG